MMKFKQTHRAKMRRRRTITITVLFLLFISICVGSCTAVRHHKATKAAEEAAQTTVASEKTTDQEASKTTETTVSKLLSNMTLEQKILQMFIVTPEALTGVSQVTAAGSGTEAALQKYPVGGIIYFEDNLTSADQTTTMISNVQKYSKEATGIPLFIAVDEEGGSVSRVAKKLGTTSFSDMGTYADQGTEVATANAKTIATDIKGFGFNLDFAPVADVSTSNNVIIGSRAYSSDCQTAAELVAAAVKGFHQGGVLCTLKHFPGHGSTVEDTHEELAHIYKDKTTLESSDFLPFVSGIKAGADLVMTTHIIDTSLDDSGLPATFSSTVVNILRKDMNFDGIIITDSLSMDAITDNYTNASAAVRAIQAGHDMILCPPVIADALAGIEEAVSAGTITEEQINQSVTRILTAKVNAGLLA